MAKVFAPNKQYSGISAGVAFANGVGECANPYLLKWFKNHGYEVEKVEAEEVPEESDQDKINTNDGEPGSNPDEEKKEEVLEGESTGKEPEKVEAEAPKQRNTRKKSE